jgi:hypothetical protein
MDTSVQNNQNKLKKGTTHIRVIMISIRKLFPAAKDLLISSLQKKRPNFKTFG